MIPKEYIYNFVYDDAGNIVDYIIVGEVMHGGILGDRIVYYL